MSGSLPINSTVSGTITGSSRGSDNTSGSTFQSDEGTRPGYTDPIGTPWSISLRRPFTPKGKGQIKEALTSVFDMDEIRA